MENTENFLWHFIGIKLPERINNKGVRVPTQDFIQEAGTSSLTEHI